MLHRLPLRLLGGAGLRQVLQESCCCIYVVLNVAKAEVAPYSEAVGGSGDSVGSEQLRGLVSFCNSTGQLSASGSSKTMLCRSSTVCSLSGCAFCGESSKCRRDESEARRMRVSAQ